LYVITFKQVYPSTLLKYLLSFQSVSVLHLPSGWSREDASDIQIRTPLTSRSSLLLQKQAGFSLVHDFSTYYEIRKLIITIFTTAGHWNYRQCRVLGFHSRMDEIPVPLGCNAASPGIWFPKFRDNVVVCSSRVEMSFEDETMFL